MKKLLVILVAVVFLTSCSPTQEQIEKAIGETQTAIASAFTATPENTNTPLATNTPTFTNTPAATNTPVPTNTPKPTNTPRPTSTPVFGVFSNPFPVGMTANLTQTIDGETVEFEFRVEEVIRGEEAWSIIRRANRFNDPPPEGYESILIKVYVRNISSSGFLTVDFYDIAVSTKGTVSTFGFYSPCCLDNAGYIELDAKLNPTGEFSGWVALAVRIDDESPLLVVGSDYDGRGGLYFELPE